MFTQPCFIRRNTPELRKKLEELGLQLINVDNTTLDCHNYDGKGHHRSIEEGRAIITYYSSHYGIVYDVDSVTNRGRIDCGINEQLFLALAALRDDSDKNQWFVDEKTGYVFFCPFDSIIESSNQFLCYIHLPSIHKLTVKELIEYFHEPSTEQRLENLANKSDC